MNLWQQHAWRFMPFRQARAFLENTRNLERAARTRSRGLCSKCCLRKPEPGYACCAECREANRRSEHKRKQVRMDAGQCVRCGKPRERKAVAHCHACIALTTGSRVRRSKARHAKAKAKERGMAPAALPHGKSSDGQDANVLK